jgi:hypothetical protein
LVFPGFNLLNEVAEKFEIDGMGLEYLGSFADIPVALVLESWKKAYGEDRVGGWIADLEAKAGESRRDFLTEDPTDE